ncbi:Hypothetical protein R9X50_00121600 [Acrodontium crateriforme]|uniref:ATP-dependent DNA helicase II subunit 2 n=1 Tax=Acrodontium crateriforme TaxID=150365 RepID=A0AAQ3M4P7_9PEZI|nr:Hypothetical protein R9X50_00121600 [Acrodontium crateriforme]
MAGKEATVYIVDCGSSMGERSNGRKQTNLEWALEYVWDKITTGVATGRKTLLAGVVGLRTDKTDNILADDENYHNIAVYQDLAQILLPQLRQLRSDLTVSANENGDAISALVIAIQMIATTCKKLQYIRKIVLVTDARGPMSPDELDEITSKIKTDGIELVVLGVDFDDAEYGFKEENKDPIKSENEDLLKKLCEDCGGIIGTLAQAVDELGIPRIKSTRPVHSYKGYLTLGNPHEYETALAIDVERYPKTMVAKAPTASSFVLRTNASGRTTSSMTNGGDESQPSNDELAAVTNTRTYQVDDEEAAGGKRDIPFEELSKGYTYGSTAVPISESDQNVTLFETQQGLDIIGFVDDNRYERYLDMSRGALIVAQKGNEKASMALSSFIHALYELESYAVARLVPKENKEPKILLLAPNIEPDLECLYDIELPFAEDIRTYRFPPLDRVVTVSGKSLKVHRNLPSDDLQEAIDSLVDSMDLSTFGKDDEGEPTEYMAMDETYSPLLHRINQVIKHRAVHPNSEPPPPYEILTRYSQPPAELIQQSKSALEKAIKAADVKKVPPKARGKRSDRKDAPKPLSELDVGALLRSDPKRKRIDPKNAIPEFKQLLNSAVAEADIQDAAKQLQKIIYGWIRHSVGGTGDDQVLEGLRVMREELTELEEPLQYNDFLKEFKGKVLGEDLGGAHTELWYKVRSTRLGPIQKKECHVSSVTEDEARAFMATK